MSSDQIQFLTLRQLPARLGVQEVAWLLGFSEEQVRILLWEGVLKPLGRPPENGVKMFALVEIKRFSEDEAWLSKASDALVKYWRRRNGKGMLHGREVPVKVPVNLANN